MKGLAAVAVIWAAIAIFWWLTVGASVAKAQPKLPDWEDIARFYAGGNMRPGGLSYDWTNTNGTTEYAGSGKIRLNPALQKSRDAFLKGIAAKTYGDRRGAVILGSPFLSTLIHEALHNRATSADFDPSGEAGPTDLGVRLIPDLLQRFFGVKMDSRLGKMATAMVLKQLQR